VPKLPRINPGTIVKLPGLKDMVPPGVREQYKRLAPSALWALEEKRDVDVDVLFGPGTRQLSGVLRVLYFLRWDPDGEGWGVRPLDAGARLAALRRLVKGLGVYDLRPAEGAHQAIALQAIADAVAAYDVVGRADVFELRTFILGQHQPHSPGLPAAGKFSPEPGSLRR